jgi:hypothetical protein
MAAFTFSCGMSANFASFSKRDCLSFKESVKNNDDSISMEMNFFIILQADSSSDILYYSAYSMPRKIILNSAGFLI